MSATIPSDVVLAFSDAELGAQFAKETGPGTLTAITDILGPGVKFNFTGLRTDVGTVVGDNFPVSPLAGGTYRTYGVTKPFSTWGGFSGYTMYRMIFTRAGIRDVISYVTLLTLDLCFLYGIEQSITRFKGWEFLNMIHR